MDRVPDHRFVPAIERAFDIIPAGLHHRLRPDSSPWLLVSAYQVMGAETEAFAEAFTAWVIPGYVRDGRQDPGTHGLLQHLAGPCAA